MKTPAAAKLSLGATLSVGLLVGLAVVGVMKHKQMEALQETQRELEEWKQTARVLEAEKRGLIEANMAVHQQLTALKKTATALSAPTPPTKQVSIADIPFDPEDRNTALRIDLPEDEWFSPPPPPPQGMPPSAPPAAPTPSPELLEMMAQFPEHDLRMPENQPNVIEEYLKANPELRRNRQPAQGGYGEGIESMARAYPELAEKLRNQKTKELNEN